MTAQVLALIVDLRVPGSRSLKEKRSVVSSITDGARHRFAVASAETGHQDERDRAELTFVAASGSSGHTVDVVDQVERFVWSFPEIEVIDGARHWLEVS